MIYHAMQYTGSAWVICTRAHRGLFMTCAFPNPDRLIACRALLLYGSRLYYEMRLLWMRLRLGQTTRSLPKSRALIFGQECTLSISNALQRDIADSNSSSCNMVHAWTKWHYISLVDATVAQKTTKYIGQNLIWYMPNIFTEKSMKPTDTNQGLN